MPLKLFLRKTLTAWEASLFYLPTYLYYFFQKNVPDLSENRYISVKNTLLSYLRNKKLDYTHYSLDKLKDNKKSDILFILGSSRFINDIPDNVWIKLKNYDTLGFNFWFYHHFAPTYYATELGFTRLPGGKENFLAAFNKRKNDYQDTIYLLTSRQRRRGFHPLLTPEYFPINPKVASFVSPKPIVCSLDRSFNKDNFRHGIYYRGSLNLYLHFALLMGFKKIVLVGCEMDSAIPFFEYFPETQWMDEIYTFDPNREERLKTQYGGAYNNKNKHSLVNTILAIDEFVFRPTGIELYVFNKKSLLYPKIPLYEF